MLRKTLILALASAAILPACDPTPTPTPQGGQPDTGCRFAANQAAAGLTMDCRVEGDLPNMRVDPANSSQTACGPLTFTLFSQNATVPLRVVYGENGDDGANRVRLGTTITGATQTGNLRKSAGENCNGLTGPTFPISTRFDGRHIALIDKGQTPHCVFQSRLDLTSFTQEIGSGFPVNVANVTRNAVRDGLARRLDFELATAVNRLLAPNADLRGDFAARGGRCADGYRPFVGN